MLGSGTKLDPFVAEAAFQAVFDHRFQQIARSLIADTMLEIAPQPLFLDGFQRTVFIVMHGRQAILGELGWR